MDRFIRKKFHVDEESKQNVYKSGQHADKGANDSIFFIGLRGSGKTTVARLVAEKRDAEFVDMDARIQESSGQDIASLVSEKGWEHFRDLEQQELQRVCAASGLIVSTGGGVVLRQENRELLKRCGTVFYLMAEPETLLRRLSGQPDDKQRPALTGLPLEEELGQTFTERHALYLECANFILRAEKNPEALCTEVLEMLTI